MPAPLRSARSKTIGRKSWLCGQLLDRWPGVGEWAGRGGSGGCCLKATPLGSTRAAKPGNLPHYRDLAAVSSKNNGGTDVSHLNARLNCLLAVRAGTGRRRFRVDRVEGSATIAVNLDVAPAALVVWQPGAGVIDPPEQAGPVV